MTKPTLAIVTLGGCDGCLMSIVDGPELLELLDAVELVSSPLDAEHRPLPPHVDVVVVEGAVTTEHDRAKLVEARNAAHTLVALGSCSVLGGVGGLRNLFSADSLEASVYGEPAARPALESRVHAVSTAVLVDVELPGCSPSPERTAEVLRAVVSGQPVISSRRNLCHECHRTKVELLNHSAEFVSDSVNALMELDSIDPDRCLLEQGLLCVGPMTREGCGAPCTAANVPCRGCSGSSRRDFEQGAKAVDALAAVLPAGALMHMEDLTGTAYRYSMAVSVFPAHVDSEGGVARD